MRLGLLVVCRVLWVLKGLAVPNAAVYHAGEMHCHGGGCGGGGGAEGHESLQWMGDGERVVISYAKVGEEGGVVMVGGERVMTRWMVV